MVLDRINPHDEGDAARVLLVDDMKSLLIIMERGLRSQGHTVYPAESGREALEIFRNNSIDVIVCDLAMEEMDGRDVSRAVRRICEERRVAKTPFVLLTGWGESVKSETLADEGVDLVMDKPVDMGELLEVIRTLTARSGKPAADR